MRLSPLLLALVIAAPVAAHADITFTFTGLDAGTFTIPSVLPDASGTTAIEYTPTTYSGDFSSVYFFTSADGGGFQNASLVYDYGFGGDQVFGGTTANPTLTNGTYEFDVYNQLGQVIPGTLGEETLVISSTGNTPEPSSLVLLGTGALGLAGAVRRRLRK